MISFARKLAPVFALALFAAVPARASMVLLLNDPATIPTDVIVIDGQLAGAVSDSGLVSTIADPDGLVNGIISYNGPAGPTFTTNVATAISKPNIGPAEIDLNDISLSSSGPGTLEIAVTDTSFLFGANGDTLQLVNAIGGVTKGSLAAQGFYSATNTEFGATVATPVQGPFGPGAFSGTVTSAPFLGTGGFFSLTEFLSFSHTAAGQTTSFNKTISVIPEPGTLLLLGGGLLGLVVHGRKPHTR